MYQETYLDIFYSKSIFLFLNNFEFFIEKKLLVKMFRTEIIKIRILTGLAKACGIKIQKTY